MGLESEVAPYKPLVDTQAAHILSKQVTLMLSLNINVWYCSRVNEYQVLFPIHISGQSDGHLLSQNTGGQRDPSTTVGMGHRAIQTTCGYSRDPNFTTTGNQFLNVDLI